jgi:hypothetical protein
VNDDLRDYRTMFASIEKRVLYGMDMTVAERLRLVGLVTLSAVGLFMSQTGSVSGWSVLVNSPAAQSESTNLLSALAVHGIAVFCIASSVAALYCRTFPVLFLATAGCAVTSVMAMMAIWSRQSLPVSSGLSGPGPGAVVGFLGAVTLTILWTNILAKAPRLGVVASEPNVSATARKWGPRRGQIE